MATSNLSSWPAYPIEWTAADWQSCLGGIPLERIRMYPRPGMASEADVLEIHARTGRLCELVDGVLVEKPMGYRESQLAAALIIALGAYLRLHKIGTVAGEAGMLKVSPAQVRIPDVSFIRWDRMPAEGDSIPAVAPDLAVEVLSESNTEQEMARKLQDYFAAGTRLVWYIDPRTRSARAYVSPEECVMVEEAGSLVGGDVLPGFEMRLADLFAAVDHPKN